MECKFGHVLINSEIFKLSNEPSIPKFKKVLVPIEVKNELIYLPCYWPLGGAAIAYMTFGQQTQALIGTFATLRKLSLSLHF